MPSAFLRPEVLSACDIQSLARCSSHCQHTALPCRRRMLKAHAIRKSIRMPVYREKVPHSSCIGACRISNQHRRILKIPAGHQRRSWSLHRKKKPQGPRLPVARAERSHTCMRGLRSRLRLSTCSSWFYNRCTMLCYVCCV